MIYLYYNFHVVLRGSLRKLYTNKYNDRFDEKVILLKWENREISKIIIRDLYIRLTCVIETRMVYLLTYLKSIVIFAQRGDNTKDVSKGDKMTFSFIS